MKKYKVYTKEYGIADVDSYDDIAGLNWHRVDGPAYIGYYGNGMIKYEGYWINNMLHRLDGPAIIQYDKNGSITFTAYWINNIEYTKDNYHKELLKRKLNSL